MRILYYTWNEITKDDTVSSLTSLGNQVDVVEYSLKSYTKDPEFVAWIEQMLRDQKYDCIYTCNYVPLISKVSFRNKIPYIAWIFDSPCITLYSEMIYNPYNYIFHFDRSEVEHLQGQGVKNIWHMPLAVNVNRVQKLCEGAEKSQETPEKLSNPGIAFMGSLYNDEFNYFSQIKNMTQYNLGFVQGIIDAQLQIYGCDLIETAMPQKMLDEISGLVSIQLEEEFFIQKKQLILNMIRKRATVLERQRILSNISQQFPTTLYSQSDSSMIPTVENRGYINYTNEMPLMFANSAINLNITLRTIQHGISLRVLDVLGAGGFLLSDYQPAIADYFQDGEDLVLYYDQKDLREKVKYYLEHEEERKIIAANGKKKIAQSFTYEVQLRKIFQLVFGVNTMVGNIQGEDNEKY